MASGSSCSTSAALTTTPPTSPTLCRRYASGFALYLNRAFESFFECRAGCIGRRSESAELFRGVAVKKSSSSKNARNRKIAKIYILSLAPRARFRFLRRFHLSVALKWIMDGSFVLRRQHPQATTAEADGETTAAPRGATASRCYMNICTQACVRKSACAVDRLFDLEEDPFEERDLASQYPEVGNRMSVGVSSDQIEPE